MMTAELAENDQMQTWIGVDVSKPFFDAAVVTPEQHYDPMRLKDIPCRRFERNPHGIASLCAWLDELEETGCVRVCMESTGSYSSELAVWMLEHGPRLRPAIVNAHYTSAFIKSLGLRNKTDKLEARALAFYGVERRPHDYEPLTSEHAELRNLSRYRDALVHEKVAAKLRADEPQPSSEVAKLQKKRLKLLLKDIERIETEMHRVVAQSEHLTRDIEQLTSIYGIGFITAVVVIAELGDLRRFKRARQLSAFAGVSPRIFQSGTSISRRTRMCKHGNARVRQALYLCAVTAVRGDSELSRFYHHLLKQGKPKMVALGAVMRKLLTIMRAILISQELYNPHYKTLARNIRELAS